MGTECRLASAVTSGRRGWVGDPWRAGEHGDVCRLVASSQASQPVIRTEWGQGREPGLPGLRFAAIGHPPGGCLCGPGPGHVGVHQHTRAWGRLCPLFWGQQPGTTCLSSRQP